MLTEKFLCRKIKFLAHCYYYTTCLPLLLRMNKAFFTSSWSLIGSIIWSFIETIYLDNTSLLLNHSIWNSIILYVILYPFTTYFLNADIFKMNNAKFTINAITKSRWFWKKRRIGKTRKKEGKEERREGGKEGKLRRREADR